MMEGQNGCIAGREEVYYAKKHIVLAVIPVIGLLFFAGVLVASLVDTNNDERVACAVAFGLFILLSVLGILVVMNEAVRVTGRGLIINNYIRVREIEWEDVEEVRHSATNVIMVIQRNGESLRIHPGIFRNPCELVERIRSAYGELVEMDPLYPTAMFLARYSGKCLLVLLLVSGLLALLTGIGTLLPGILLGLPLGIAVSASIIMGRGGRSIVRSANRRKLVSVIGCGVGAIVAIVLVWGANILAQSALMAGYGNLGWMAVFFKVIVFGMCGALCIVYVALKAVGIRSQPS